MTDRPQGLLATPLQRVFAFGADYIVIAVYAAFLTFLSFYIADGEFKAPVAVTDKIAGHMLGFATMTLPVVLYFSLLESGRAGASLGKRLLRVRVTQTNGAPLGLRKSLFRNLLKFAPWEIAHAAIWHVPGRPFLDPMPAANLGFSIGALTIVILYILSLFIGGRTLYDRLAGTIVTRAAL